MAHDFLAVPSLSVFLEEVSELKQPAPRRPTKKVIAEALIPDAAAKERIIVCEGGRVENNPTTEKLPVVPVQREGRQAVLSVGYAQSKGGGCSWDRGGALCLKVKH